MTTSLTERALRGALVVCLAAAGAAPGRAAEPIVIGEIDPLTGPGLRDALAAADVMTPMGPVRFDDRGDPASYEHAILQIQDGRHDVVWPKERAEAAAR